MDTYLIVKTMTKKTNWTMIAAIAAVVLIFLSGSAAYTDVKEDVKANSTKIASEEKINDERYEHIKEQLQFLVERAIQE